jgi:hypothetical protein
LIVHVANDDHELDAGDSIYFDSSASHAYRSGAGKGCAALVIVVP